MTRLRILPALLVAGLALPTAAQVFETFPYEMVSAFGANNERDVNEGSCDLVLGCFDRNGVPCADNPSQPCDLATVPAGRCVTGNRPANVWPSKSGECEGTLGYFERGPPILGDIQENTASGVPCLTPDYAAALAAFSMDPDRDDSEIVALESVNGPSSMCPGNGTCAMKKCIPLDASTGVVACNNASDCPNPGDSCVKANDNSANCQAFDARPSFCQSDPNVACGIDVDLT